MSGVKNLTRPLRIAETDEIALTGKVEDGEIVVRSQRTDRTSGTETGRGVEVFRLGYHHKLKSIDPEILDHVAREVASAIRDAYRTGFDDGREFVAEAMGLGQSRRT